MLGLFLSGLVVFGQTGQTKLPNAPGNLDFETDKSGQPVSAWRLNPASAAAGYSFTASDENPFKGGFSGLLKKGENQAGQTPGIVIQSFDAADFRGKRIRFRAAVRAAAGNSGQTQLWLRVDRQAAAGTNPPIGFFDNMADRPIKSDKWTYYEIVGDVASDAATINLGLLMLGGGSTWIDDASFETIGNAEVAVNEPPRPLSNRGLENVTAFARLMGYVRHFHPSDEAAKIDWESFTISGIRRIENAKNASELAQELKTIFNPVAPTVEIYAGKKKFSAVPESPPSATKAVRWEHYGFGTGNPGVYRSTRIDTQIEKGKLPPDLPPPFVADLGAGVSARIPLYLPADANGTLPRVQRVAAKANETRPTKMQYSANDRATRLADVALAWNVFEHFYPYFDETRVNWMPVLPEMLKRAAADKDEREFKKTLEIMVSRLRDGHGNVAFGAPTNVFAAPLTWDVIEGKLIITSVAKPLDGLRAGDAVVSINGQPALQALQEKENYISAATEQWKRFRALQELSRGEKGESVTLEIEPYQNPDQPRKVAIARDTLFYTVGEKRPDKVSELAPGVFYLNLDEVTSKDFNDILPKLETAKGIIFDLRGYPKLDDPFGFFSHLSDKPLTSAKFMIPVITVPDHRNMKFQTGGDWQIKPAAPFLKAKKVFITDGRAISYAESVMGIVEYYRLGEIVGAPTAGTNGNINPFALPGGYQIVWTGMKVEKQDGARHHGVGILPTVPVARTRSGAAAGKDEFLEKAIEILNK